MGHIDLHQRIEDWLNQASSSLGASSDFATTQPNKKRKLNPTTAHLPSPTSSLADHQPLSYLRAQPMSHSSSRKRKISSRDDNQKTPRARKTPSSIFDNAPSLVSQSESQASGRTSPIKQFPIMGLDNYFIDCQTMNPDQVGLPSELVDVLGDMQDISSGFAYIPSFLRPEIEKRKQSSLALGRIREHAYRSTETNRSPSDPNFASQHFNTISRLVERAIQCHHQQYDETGWNHLVHTPLLDLCRAHELGTPDTSFDFSPCMNASIDLNFHNFLSPPSKIDYALVHNPLDDRDTAEAMARLQSLMNGSVNHTTFAPLRQTPIAVSIETKRHGGDGRRAEVQMALWHAAQWAFFESLAKSSVGDLPFLPGIIVNGHDWRFVATTYKDKKTILWSSHYFGSTSTSPGVLQIIAGIERLAQWSAASFWPWFRENMLTRAEEDLGSTAPSSSADDRDSDLLADRTLVP